MGCCVAAAADESIDEEVAEVEEHEDAGDQMMEDEDEDADTLMWEDGEQLARAAALANENSSESQAFGNGWRLSRQQRQQRRCKLFRGGGQQQQHLHAPPLVSSSFSGMTYHDNIMVPACLLPVSYLPAAERVQLVSLGCACVCVCSRLTMPFLRQCWQRTSTFKASCPSN